MPSNTKTVLTVKKNLRISHFSLPQLIIFILAFGLIGYFVYRSFATAPLVATLEAEQMSLPSGASVITDSTASAGQAIKLVSNGAASGSVNFPSSVTSLTVLARGDQCSGAPSMTVMVDGTTTLSNTAVSSTAWNSYSFTPATAWASGTHSLSIAFTNAYSTTTYKGNSGKIRGTCTRALYADVTNFYGPVVITPPPTVTLSASPTSVTAGTASTLTWASTNASSCTASGAWSGTEPTSGSVSTGALNTTSTYSLTCTGSGGSASASTTVTVTSSGGGGSCAYSNAAWCSATNFPVPSFTATRTIDVTSQSAFMTAWSNLQAGDQINVHGVTFTGEVILASKELSNWAQVSFDSATKFVGSSSVVNDPSVWIHDNSHIRFYGGDFSSSASGGMGGGAILLYGNTYVTMWNFVSHDTGGAGISILPVASVDDHLDIKGEVFDWGHNLNWDPHAEKGTGLHGALIGDADYGVTNSRIAIYAHDGATGAGLEWGGNDAYGIWQYNTVYAWCQNLTFVALQQTAANCLQVWGQKVYNNTIAYVEAENLQGRVYEAGGMYGGQSLATDIVQYGRATNTNQNQSLDGGRLKGYVWDTYEGTVFQNVSPLP